MNKLMLYFGRSYQVDLSFELYSPVNWEELEYIHDKYRGFFFTNAKLNVEVMQNFVTQKY